MTAATAKATPKERDVIWFNYAMQYRFREEANFGILEGFLSELIGKKVKVLEILKNKSKKGTHEAQVNHLGLKAKIGKGDTAIFEIQYSDGMDYYRKVTYSASKTIIKQIAKGVKYDVKKFYMINILNYGLSLGVKRDYLFVAQAEGFKGVHFDEIISFAQKENIVPPKSPKADIRSEYYLILPEFFDGKVRTKFDEWVYVLKNAKVKSGFKALGIQELSEKFYEQNMTVGEYKSYERYMRNVTDLHTVFETAHYNGIERGRKEGMAEKLLANGMAAEKVAEITGLSIEEVKAL
jgi:predicted transposase/invertase (TIGR01784 family)